MKPNPEILPTLFPPIHMVAEDIEGTPPELYDYRKDFGGRDWTEVPSHIYNTHSDAYCLMEPETLVHYLGGFLNTALNDLNSLAGEHLVYHAGQHSFFDLTKLLSKEQKKFLIETIDYLLLSNSYFSISNAVHYDKIRGQIL